MDANTLARKIVEAILVRLDDHVHRYGLASVDEEMKQSLITLMEQMIKEDREYF